MTTYHLLLAAENEEEIKKYLECFQNNKMEPQHHAMLWQIIKNTAVFNTKYATPTGHFIDTSLNNQHSVNIEKVLDEKLQVATYEEHVLGILTRLDFQTSAISRFGLLSSIDNHAYIGVIDSALDKSIPDLALNFKSKEYDCRLHVTFTPESKFKVENYEYKLMDISEV